MGQITGYTGTFENQFKNHLDNMKDKLGKSILENAKKTIVTVDRNLKIGIKKA